MDKRTRRLITIYMALYLRDDGDKSYMSRKVGRRELASIEGPRWYSNTKTRGLY